ncbi:MAG: peptidylprolyl isomerase [Phycisphaerae bacterium]|nr:peptidylprolyl isomerase [Phycisphaerae bacterium]
MLLGLGLLLVDAGCASRPAETSGGSAPSRVEMMTSRGAIVIELDPARAPVTVANFLDHARAGHYDGTIIHRVVPGFVIQGGGWTPDLVERARLDAKAGRPDALIRNEWRTSGLMNRRGTIAMARETDPDSATREFFINLADNVKLDTPREVSGGAGYAVFGRVVAGMEVVDAIAGVATRPRPETGVEDGSMNHVPVESVVVMSVREVE